MRLFLIFLLIVTVDAGFFDSIKKLVGIGGSSSDSSSNKKEVIKKRVDDNSAKSYLSQFGYVGPSNSLATGNGMSGDVSDSKSILRRAIEKFQEFAGIAKTGLLDEVTKLKMAASRCGVTDVQAITDGGAAFKWRKNRVTYSIENFSSDLPKDDVRRAIRDAYNVWSEVTPLEFEEVPAGQGDIKVRFGVHNHNDPWPFDGEGGVLAHATMPENGALHFDDDEAWTFKDARKIATGDYTDLYAVAIHEGGHTLGLEHSKDQTSIMAPFYHKTVDDNGNYLPPVLKPDDIRAIQDIYGPRTSRSGSGGGSSWGGSGGDIPSNGFTTTTPRPTTRSSWGGSDPWGGSGGSSWGGSSGGSSSGGGNCPRSVDAYATSDAFSYLFSGSNVYELSTNRVRKVYAIKDMFPSAPVPVQAAVFNPVAGMMLLFSNGRIYGYYYSRLRGIFQMDSGYPKTLPSDIRFRPAGAFRWINGHQILVSDGDDFSVYDEFWNQSTMLNKISGYFPNLPQGIKGMESPSGSSVTAFTSSEVIVYNSRTKQIESHKPLSSYLTC